MKRSKKALYYIALSLFAAIFLISATMLVLYYGQSYKSQSTYNDLANLVDAARPTANATAPVDSDVPADNSLPPYITVTDPDTGISLDILREYAVAYDLNSDLVGWIRIEGTNINHPVVQTVDRPDHYLRRDFYGSRDTHGCIYVEEACDVFAPSDNITIYGHRMQDGTMFAALEQYQSKDFWQSHSYIRFDTLTQHRTYQVLYVFITSAAADAGFSYHNFVNAQDSVAFDHFIGQCKQRALYDTGMDAIFGDKLITLSTCDYSLENGRLVIVAKQVS